MEEPISRKALEVLEGFVKRDKASLSDAQRYHRLGFNRASKIMRELSKLGYISNGNLKAEVRITEAEFLILKENEFESD